MSDQLTRPAGEPAPAGAAPGSSRGASLGRGALQAVVILVVFAVVGVVAGLVWEAWWTPPQMVVQQHQVYYADESAIRGAFSGTALYALVASVAGLLTALGVCLAYRGRELVTLVAVLAGSAIAAWLMWKVGEARGPADPHTLMATAKDGTKVLGSLHVSHRSPFLAWPMTAVVAVALVFFSLPGRASRPQHLGGTTETAS